MDRKYRKSQQDIIGLVIIVLIFVVALSFVLFFSLRPGESDFLKDFDEELHGHNTITAVLQTTHDDCRGISTVKLIEQCAWLNSWAGESCKSSLGNTPSSLVNTPCDYAAERIDFMLRKSLYDKNFDYRFRVYTEQDIVNGEVQSTRIDIKTAECKGDILSSTQPLNYRGGKLFITLELCEA